MMSPRPLYDLIVITFTSCTGHFAQRLEAFARYGLVNFGNRRVKHIMLHSGAPIPKTLLRRWPCECQVIQHEKNQVNVKICGFFAEHGPSLLDEARWIAKWDDDSVTDIDGLLENLDGEFNWNDPLYLIADQVCGIDDPMRQVLRTMGFDRWIRRAAHGKFLISHEWEGSILSNQGLRRMVECKVAMQFLRLCMTIARDSFGDQSLALAARMAKVHPIDVPFMTKDDAWEDLTIFGGRHAHIHYLAPDKGERWTRFVEHYERWLGGTGMTAAATDAKRRAIAG
jgi:hypothetical protein